MNSISHSRPSAMDNKMSMAYGNTPLIRNNHMKMEYTRGPVLECEIPLPFTCNNDNMYPNIPTLSGSTSINVMCMFVEKFLAKIESFMRMFSCYSLTFNTEYWLNTVPEAHRVKNWYQTNDHDQQNTYINVKWERI